MDKIVDGSTQLLGIVGDPIRQVRAPEVWSAPFKANGFNAACVPLHVKPAGLEAFVTGLKTIQNVVGLIVTIPHKPSAVHLCDALTSRARLVQSVNVMRREADGRWTGDILDGFGFMQGLLGAGQRVEGRRALVVGSGGVGTAIAFAIAEAKAASVHVADIAQGRAADLARRLQAAGYTPARAGCGWMTSCGRSRRTPPSRSRRHPSAMPGYGRTSAPGWPATLADACSNGPGRRPSRLHTVRRDA